MKNSFRAGIGIILGICLCFALSPLGYTRPHSSRLSQNAAPSQKEPVVTTHAKGTFDVKLNPQPPDDKSSDGTSDAGIARMILEKQLHGDLEGTSKGQMLAFSTGAKNSGAYVAIEKIAGTLQGRTGSFALQHIGAMSRGAYQLNITVVPDSGTGQLEGIAGTFSIQITDGKHFYDFAYTLAQAP